MEGRATKQLDCVAHAVAIIDGQGSVVGCNSAWTRLVRRGTLPLSGEPADRRRVTPPSSAPAERELEPVASRRPPANLLAGLETLGERGWPMGEAIRAVLEARVTHARHEWWVRGVWQNRWLEMDVSAREQRGGRPHALVQILDITKSKRAELLRSIMRESARTLAESRWEQIHTAVARAALPHLEWALGSRWEVRPRGAGFDARLVEIWTPSGAVPSDGWTRIQKLDTEVVKRAASSGCPQLEESVGGRAPWAIAIPCGLEDSPTSVVLFAAQTAPTPGDLADLGYLFQQAFGADDLGLLTGGVEPVRLAACEREQVLGLLEAANGNLRRVASWLGISRSTLYDKLRRYGVQYEGRRRSQVSDASDSPSDGTDKSAA